MPTRQKQRRRLVGTGAAITAQGTPLQRVAGSANGSAIAQRLVGSLSLGLLKETSVVAADFVTDIVGTTSTQRLKLAALVSVST